MVSPIAIATVGVGDLDRSIEFYRQSFGYEPVAEGEVAGPELEELWRLPKGLSGRASVVGAPGVALGRLRLIEWSESGERIWGSYDRPQDHGHYALNLRVRDLDDAWQRMLNAGAEVRSEPKTWLVSEGLLAHDSMCYDPDGVICDVFQLPDDGPLGPLAEQSSELQTMAIHASDMAVSTAFYTGLGYEVMYDQQTEGMEGFLHIPEGTLLHNVNMYMPEISLNARVELASYVGVPGSSVGSRAVPPNIGIHSITFESGDIAADSALIETLGGTLVAGPSMVSAPPYGDAMVATFLGPDGEALELVELP